MRKWVKAGAICALVLGILAVPAAKAAEDTNADVQVVHEFLESWSGHDIDKIMANIADDVRYENIPPLGPEGVMTGKAKMQAFLEPFFKADSLVVPMSFHTVIQRTVADGKGGVAIQRMDHQIIAGKDYLNPVAAFFTVKDGKITSWTDYFDGKTLDPVVYLMEGLAKK